MRRRTSVQMSRRSTPHNTLGAVVAHASLTIRVTPLCSRSNTLRPTGTCVSASSGLAEFLPPKSGWYLSAVIIPHAASIATRPCFSSASRYLVRE